MVKIIVIIIVNKIFDDFFIRMDLFFFLRFEYMDY